MFSEGFDIVLIVYILRKQVGKKLFFLCTNLQYAGSLDDFGTLRSKKCCVIIHKLCCIFEITKKESTVSLTQLELQNEDFDREKEVEVNYSSV